MHELNNILSPLSLASLFLTQQLTCKSKIEKQNVSLDIFASDTSIIRNLNLPEERTFQLHMDPYSFLWIRFWYLCCSKISNIWDKSKQSQVLAAGKCELFHAVCNQVANESMGRATTVTFSIFIPLFLLKTIFPALKLTENCYLTLSYSHFFFKTANLIINWLLLSNSICRTENIYILIVHKI